MSTETHSRHSETLLIFSHSVQEPIEMWKFKRSAFLTGQNILNVTQRTLFSDKTMFLEKVRKNQTQFRVRTENNCQLVIEIKNILIPRLLATTLLTQVATKNDEYINVLRQRLIRIYGDSMQKPEDIQNLTHLGPVTMQVFHQLDWPEKALEFYYEFNNQYFDSKRTVLILMDLLFESKRYNDILNVYRIRSTERKRGPSSTLRICTYAACYKLNTPESLQYAIDLQRECEADINHNWRIDFVVMLAVNQNRFDLALSLLGDSDHLPANNIRLLAMAELNDWNGVCNLLKKIEKNGPIDKRYRISTEVSQKIGEKLDLSKQSLSSHEWETCYSCLYKIQHSRVSVTHPQTMDEILCMPIQLRLQNDVQPKGNHPDETQENNYPI